MEAFAATFTKAQPELFEEADTPFLLAYSTIMLNTDLHNESQKNKMTKAQFIDRNMMVRTVALGRFWQHYLLRVTQQTQRVARRQLTERALAGVQ